MYCISIYPIRILILGASVFGNPAADKNRISKAIRKSAYQTRSAQNLNAACADRENDSFDSWNELMILCEELYNKTNSLILCMFYNHNM